MKNTMEIQRYSHMEYDDSAHNGMEKDEHGVYVSYSDHLALVSGLRAEIAEAERVYDALCNDFGKNELELHKELTSLRTALAREKERVKEAFMAAIDASMCHDWVENGFEQGEAEKEWQKFLASRKGE